MDEAEVVEKHRKFLFPNVATYYDKPLVPLKANGLTVLGADGREYLDFFGGILTVSVGHCHPTVTERVVEQQRTLVHVSTLFPTVPQVQLAERIAQLAPFPDARSVFTNSGTEADETAVLLAKVATGRREVIALRHSYAGRGTFAINAMGQAPWRPVDSELPGIKHAHAPYCYRCDFHLKYPDCNVACARDIETLIRTETRGEIAAMIAEPVMGVGGFVVPPREYFKVASEIVRNHGGLFIADEVQTGFGRTGRWWGSEHFDDFVPDILTSAKGMANGQPIGLTTARGEIAEKFRSASLSTFGGNPVSMTAALATLDVIEEERLLFNAQAMGERLREGLDSLQRDFPVRLGDVRGLGLMQAVEIVRDAGTKEPDPQATLRVMEAARERGLIVGKGGLWGNVLRIAPPLVVGAGQVDDALRVLADSFAEAFSG